MTQKEKKYFISDYTHHTTFHTANIARKHIELWLEKEGFTKIEFQYQKGKNVFSRTIYLLKYILTAFKIPKRSIVFFSYPIFPTYTKVIHAILKKRNQNILIHFIHDLDGIRDKDPIQLKKDQAFFKNNDNYIVLNEIMRNYILALHPNADIANIRYHLYNCESIPFSNRTISNHVAFAGQLGKSLFVHQLHSIPGIHFHIYGESSTKKIKHPNVDIEGVYAAEQLPFNIKGSFGLVWDGDSIDDCSGNFGAYLKINLPHKLSLYLLAGLPIIIYSDAALAETIVNDGIGITIHNLSDLSEKIAKITPEQYENMLFNIKKINTQIQSGQYLRQALYHLMQRNINAPN